MCRDSEIFLFIFGFLLFLLLTELSSAATLPEGFKGVASLGTKLSEGELGALTLVL